MAVDNIARGMAASALKNQGGGGSSLPIVNTAAIGQTIRVSAVDDAGKPTEWEAVEFPAGGEKWETLCDLVLEEDVNMVEVFSGDVGYKKLHIYGHIIMPTEQTITGNKSVSAYSKEAYISEPTIKFNNAYRPGNNSWFVGAVELDSYGGLAFFNDFAADTGNGNESNTCVSFRSANSISVPIKDLTIQVWGNGLLGIGTRIIVCGVRA